MLDTVAKVAEWGVVWLTIGAAASGLVLVVANNEIKRRDAARAIEKERLQNERTAAMERSVAEARERAAKADKNAADSKAAQQRVEIQLDKQRERTANAERSLAEVREQIADRDISAIRTRLVSELQAIPRSSLAIETQVSDAEAGQYGQQIVAAFRDAGWTIESDTLAALVPFQGVRITGCIRNEKTVSNIVNTFVGLQINARGRVDTTCDHSTILVQIGSK